MLFVGAQAELVREHVDYVRIVRMRRAMRAARLVELVMRLVWLRRLLASVRLLSCSSRPRGQRQVLGQAIALVRRRVNARVGEDDECDRNRDRDPDPDRDRDRNRNSPWPTRPSAKARLLQPSAAML